jgi:uncharacterized Zn-binding protein involved in type VI secretion
MAETGVAPAIVVDARDPKGLGRVRVRYPWHERPDDGYWARVVAPLGGPIVGAAPQVGEETGAGAHVGGVVSVGSNTVFIGGHPAARAGDLVVEVGGPNAILTGALTVLIG